MSKLPTSEIPRVTPTKTKTHPAASLFVITAPVVTLLLEYKVGNPTE